MVAMGYPGYSVMSFTMLKDVALCCGSSLCLRVFRFVVENQIGNIFSIFGQFCVFQLFGTSSGLFSLLDMYSQHFSCFYCSVLQCGGPLLGQLLFV